MNVKLVAIILFEWWQKKEVRCRIQYFFSQNIIKLRKFFSLLWRQMPFSILTNFCLLLSSSNFLYSDACCTCFGIKVINFSSPSFSDRLWGIFSWAQQILMRKLSYCLANKRIFFSFSFWERTRSDVLSSLRKQVFSYQQVHIKKKQIIEKLFPPIF